MTWACKWVRVLAFNPKKLRFLRIEVQRPLPTILGFKCAHTCAGVCLQVCMHDPMHMCVHGIMHAHDCRSNILLYQFCAYIFNNYYCEAMMIINNIGAKLIFAGYLTGNRVHA